jgi:hypothetical protein
MKRKYLAFAAIILCAFLATITVQNVLIAACFPHLTRFTSDFSPTYLQRELKFIASQPSQTIFLGDSVLWGYLLPPDQSAISILSSRGCACRNLAFKGSSPPNYYALALLLQAYGVRPKGVVIEVDQKMLSPSYHAYRSVQPGVARLVEPLLPPGDRATLALLGMQPNPLLQALSDAVSSYSLMFAMRPDIRETFSGASGDVPISIDFLKRTYDSAIAPLSEGNVGVRYLEKTIEAFHASGIPVLAFLTPMNHELMHGFLDKPSYRENDLFLRRVLGQRGAHVLDLDQAFPADVFMDDLHLTAQGQGRLASALAGALPS